MTILKRLTEQSEFVVDAVADGGQVEGCQRIEETGGEASQTTIAQPHVVFLFSELVDILAEFPECIPRGFVDAGVVQVVQQHPTHEVFQTQVIGPTRLGVVMRLLCAHEVIQQAIPDGERSTDRFLDRCHGVAGGEAETRLFALGGRSVRQRGTQQRGFLLGGLFARAFRLLFGRGLRFGAHLIDLLVCKCALVLARGET